MAKRDKHIKIEEKVVEVIEKYAEIKQWQRNKSIAYEEALKVFIEVKREELVNLGVSAELISEAIGPLSVNKN